jgi:hypothetical protein
LKSFVKSQGIQVSVWKWIVGGQANFHQARLEFPLYFLRDTLRSILHGNSI